VATAALVIVRITTATWIATAAWRCVFVLLEIRGLELRVFEFVVSRRLPPLPRIQWNKTPCSRLASSSILPYSAIIVALLLTWPSNFSAPLLAGALYCSTGNMTSDREILVPSGTHRNGFGGWPSFPNFDADIGSRHFQAISYAGLTWQNVITNTSGCRHIVNDNGLPTGSLLFNVIVPCMKIDNISWYKKNSVSDEIRSFVTNDSNFLLKKAPLNYLHTGNVALFNLTKWIPDSAIPSPTLFSGQKYIAVRLLRDEDGRTINGNNLNSTIFGDLSQLKENVVDERNECKVYGAVSFTAGIAITEPVRSYNSGRSTQQYRHRSWSLGYRGTLYDI
jgi:hypothetical protein